MCQETWEDLGMSCRMYLALKMSDSSGDLVVNIVKVIFFIVGGNGSGESQVSDEPSCPGKLNRPPLPSCNRRRIWNIRRRWNIGRIELRLWDIRRKVASAGRNSYPGGMSYDSTRRKGGGLHGQGRGSHVAIFGEDPTWGILKYYL